MDTKQVTRSSKREVVSHRHGQEGVGARHMDGNNHQWGGGYLDICTDLEVSKKNSRDPRLDELADMGIGGFWRSLADDIGFDAFMVVWNSLSCHASGGDDGHRVYIPRYDAFMRYQRNRMILSLSSTGLKARDIRERVISDLREHVSINHINKLIRQHTVK
ncbi:MAG: hypothetical protein COA83_04580 [Methylophaga sp.]|nr:MAG: hypothetical protein COA83_04580 [Methylophaga sp.]